MSTNKPRRAPVSRRKFLRSAVAGAGATAALGTATLAAGAAAPPANADAPSGGSSIRVPPEFAEASTGAGHASTFR